ncbi:hypothetical protein ACFX2A_034661 [Malus domestica]
MKSVQKSLQILSRASKFTTTPLSFSISSSASEPITAPKPTKQPQPDGLTQEDFTKINLILPYLCLLNHLDTATHLAITALLVNPHLESVSSTTRIRIPTLRPSQPCPLPHTLRKTDPKRHSRKWMVREGLKFLRAMLGANIVPRGGVRKWAYRGLLREDRIKEAVELNEALGWVGLGANDDESEGVKKVLALLDHMIFSCTD